MDSIKDQAVKLRKSGYSYSMIMEKIKVPKSTLSNWVGLIPFSPNKEVTKKIGLAKLKSASFKHNQKIAEIEEMKSLAKMELGQITKRDLWLLGIGLYLGEGTKAHEQVRFSNSNPAMMQIAVRWFKEICGLRNENFRPVVHVYPDNNIEEVVKYWSKIIGIERGQFGKTQIDRRSDKVSFKNRFLPYGTLHLRIKSFGNKEFGRRLHRRIMGWIESSVKQV